METLGNPDLLKKEIENKYASKISKILGEGKKEMDKLKRQSHEKVKEISLEAQQQSIKDLQIAYDTSYNEVMSEAKKNYELYLEEKYEDVFASVIKDADKICSSASFVSWVALFVKTLKKKCTLKCNSKAKTALSKKIKAKYVVNNKVKGALVEVDGTTYDFTIETLLETKRDDLRKIISDILLKGA